MGPVRASAYISRAPRICPPARRASRSRASSPTPARSKHDPRAPPPRFHPGAMAQVLIIDDHDSMRDGLELLLRKRGHRTLSADGGQRGLDILQEEGADLVITD